MAEAEIKKQNRRTILLLLAVFTLPVIIAYSAYFGGWFTQVNTSNRGQLLTPVIDFTQFESQSTSDDKIAYEIGSPWRLILPITDASCLESEGVDGCLLSIYIMGQTHQALGKEQERVKRSLYTAGFKLPDSKITELKERFVELEIIHGNAITETELSDGYIYIADPLGNIMMRYPLITEKSDAFLKGKDVLKDLKKLLKLSRIG
ncbi:MAG: hypothetical protein KJO69_11240 [Gammaproteobacteria bacterium]|nr:hypothetical protein [Gammaproteobacteria bacterium]NNJ72882.1 hypothetical protein [Enterobacterales bacterium]